jgi:hypothetical protein
VDEKSQIQALDLTQPGLPLKKGSSQTITHDHKLSGITTSVAALDTATGEIYDLCQQKRRHQEWLRFLRMIDQTIPTGKDIYLICNNYSTHKHECVQHWLENTSDSTSALRPSRLHGSTWWNASFAASKPAAAWRLFQDVEQLIMAVGEYIGGHNENPKPFILTAKANDILESVNRAKTALNKRRPA